MVYIILLLIILGWLSGWLVNYLSDVLPVNRRLSRPLCLNCQSTIRWYDYLLFRNCTRCGKRRRIRIFIVQALLTIVPALLWKFPRPGFPFVLALILLIYLTLIFVIDLEYRLILNEISLTGAILGLGIGIYIRSRGSIEVDVFDTLLGGVVGYGIMLIFYFLGDKYVKAISKKRGISTNEVALGFGDVNLAGILGLLLGWPAIFAGLLFTVLAGGIVSLFIILGKLLTKRYKPFTAIPYAPFLILSAIYLLYLV